MPPKAAITSSKYIVTLANGAELDITRIDPQVPASGEVVDALKRRIVQLQDELDSRGTVEPPAKRARKTPASANSDALGVKGTAGTGKTAAANAKRRKATLKKLFDQLKKDCKTDTNKFQGSPKTIKVDDAMDLEDFKLVFKPGEIGDLIQPTPENKPNSTVWMIGYSTKAEVQSLLGDELKALKGNLWTIGGGPSFAKSIKLGACDVEVISADLTYQVNTMKLSVKFNVQQLGGGDHIHGSSGFGFGW